MMTYPVPAVRIKEISIMSPELPVDYVIHTAG